MSVDKVDYYTRSSVTMQFCSCRHVSLAHNTQRTYLLTYLLTYLEHKAMCELVINTRIFY